MDNTNNGLSGFSLSDFTINKDNEDFYSAIKNKNTFLMQCKNPLEDITLTIAERKNTASNDKVPIVGYLYSGFDEKINYLNTLEKLHNKFLELSNLYLCFQNGIPILADEEITKEVSKLLIGTNSNVDSNLIAIVTNKSELYNITNKKDINLSIKEAFTLIINKYVKNEVGVNTSKFKNFVIKILSWCKEYIKQIYISEISDYNPKCIYYGSIKKHESYFIMLLNMVGADILIVEPSGQSEWRNIDKDGKLLAIFEGKFKENIKENPFGKAKQEAATTAVKEEKAPPKILVNSQGMLAINLKRSLDIFKDIKLKVTDRGGLIEGKSPIVPIYFYRYIGMEQSEFTEIEYNNKIYLLDKELEGSGCNYLKFTGLIEPPKNEEVQQIANGISNIFDKLKTLDLNIIFNDVINYKLLPQYYNKSVNNSIQFAFREMFTIYSKKENTNLTKAKNFLAKLVVWINRYSKTLLKNIPQDGFLIYNPKILYFGEIKSAEVYLLIFFSLIGCDVLYINSDYNGDDIFRSIDSNETYTMVQKNDINANLGYFPQEEKLVRKATVAYEASGKVEELLFTPDSGIYKPWQFESYNALPITLKTTFEEIAILWEEEARVRPDFKIANNTVYVPNIFAKINGTHEDLERYWEFTARLRNSANTVFIDKIPFSTLNYTREEMFSLAYVLNKDGYVDKEKIMTTSFYKYSYLRKSTQNLIIEKINELIKCDFFINAVDNKFKLKIIFTALNLNENIIKLVQNFDFPFNIPKVVIYANDRTEFSEEDIITILLLNLLCMDVIILTPTGYNNIENSIKAYAFDTHNLPTYKLDLTFKSGAVKKEVKSIFSKIFK